MKAEYADICWDTQKSFANPSALRRFKMVAMDTAILQGIIERLCKKIESLENRIEKLEDK